MRKKYQSDAPEAVRKRSKKSRENNREKRRIARREWLAKNRDSDRASSRRWHAKNRDRVRAYSYRDNKHLRLKRYGLTVEQFALMLAEQQNRCGLCASEFTEENGPHVDHSHGTGAVRSLLCRLCNMGIGCFRDRPSLAGAAAEYLKRHGSKD